MLAQFNLAQLPENIFPSNEGILQFFIDSDDDLSGANFDDWSDNNGFRVLFYPIVDEDYLSADEVEKIYGDYKPEYSPIAEGEWGLGFTEKVELLSYDDYRFQDSFLSKWNELYPNSKITSMYGDLSEEIMEQLYDDIQGFSHKLLGYSGFTQTDPREYEPKYREFELLFQMDSEMGEDLGYDIMWGDSGVCNFFIRPEDLAKLDFSNVGYNWDCY